MLTAEAVVKVDREELFTFMSRCKGKYPVLSINVFDFYVFGYQHSHFSFHFLNGSDMK